MNIVLRKITNDREFLEIIDVPSTYMEVNMKVSYLQQMDCSDSPNVYGGIRFVDKGHKTDRGVRIFDFDGYFN